MVEIDQLVSASTDSPHTVAIPRTNRSAPFIRWSAWIDVIGVAYVLGTWACFVVLRPDLNPLSHYLSEYVHGPYGTLMTSTFAVLGFAWAMLAAGLFRTITPAGRSWFGLGVLALGSALTFGMGLFPTEPSGAAPTMAGTLHRLLAKLFFVSICPGILALTIAWRHDRAWSSVVRPALALGGSALVGLIFLVSCPPELSGFAQRMMLSGILGWHMLAAWRVGRLGIPADG